MFNPKGLVSIFVLLLAIPSAASAGSADDIASYNDVVANYSSARAPLPSEVDGYFAGKCFFAGGTDPSAFNAALLTESYETTNAKSSIAIFGSITSYPGCAIDCFEFPDAQLWAWMDDFVCRSRSRVDGHFMFSDSMVFSQNTSDYSAQTYVRILGDRLFTQGLLNRGRGWKPHVGCVFFKKLVRPKGSSDRRGT